MDYKKLTKKELVQICKDKNIVGISNKTKLKLIELIKNNLEITKDINEDINKDIDQNTNQDNKIIKDIEFLDINDVNHIDIISSEQQTKVWRAKCNWYKNGKSNECEIYQKKILKQLLGYEPSKCNDRINMEKLEIVKKYNPISNINGFEYTEDFDGKIKKENSIYYFNLKFCCDTGGAQTRTLRLVYDFIKYQIKYLVLLHENSILHSKPYYFINILDGDTCNNHMNKFMYLLKDRKGYIKNDILDIIKKYIFIGDMLKFSNSDFISLLIKKN